VLIQHIHHVAYRCKDAKQTVEWYEKHLGMKFVLAIAENEVPSTKAPDPYMHIFIQEHLLFRPQRPSPGVGGRYGHSRDDGQA
jgi:catechol 2,3-dioxygenase-like lactoylglutathione lyase family enzyme